MFRKFLSAAATIVLAAGIGIVAADIRFNTNTTANALTDAQGGEYTEGTYENLTYWKYADHILITKYNGSAKSIDIPAEIEGLPVTEIGDFAFKSCPEIENISIPDSVTDIRLWAFEYTKWLENKQAENPLVIVNNILIDGRTCEGDVVIPNSVTKIGNSAFSGCWDISSITIPDSVVSIDNMAFSMCVNLTDVKLPCTITEISDSAFTNCRSLTGITIPDSVMTIGYSAFSGSGLTSVTIPESVTAIEEHAFLYCANLDEITLLNSDCDIYDSEETISYGIDKGFKGKLYGRDNSTAQAYAKKYGYKFRSLDSASGEKFPAIPVAIGVLGVSAIVFAVLVIHIKKKK